MIVKKINPHPSKNRVLFIIFISIILIGILFLFIFKLDVWPSVWWDEGWTLDAARNWITQGHLGHYLDGQPIPPRIPLRFPVAVSVALSMKFFGIGVWQGRLPEVIYAILSLCLLVYLCSKIYTLKVGIAVLLIVIFLSNGDFNPIVQGRRIFAEMPMLFYLLGGYVMTWLALKYSPIWGINAALLFGIANITKLQVPPFWLISMVIAILVATKHKDRSSPKILVGITLGSIAAAIIIYFIQNKVMPGSFDDPELIKILFNSVVLVINWPVRKIALSYGVLYALPQILGMIWAGKQTWKYLSINSDVESRKSQEGNIHIMIIRASLWGLSASWCFWYLFMALFWLRYLFPPFFIGTVFFAAYLSELTNGFDFRFFVQRAASLLLGRETRWINFQSCIALIAISLTLGASLKLAYSIFTNPVTNPDLVADFINNKFPTGSKIETFESELLFLAPDMDYHYPSDLISMQLFRKWCIDPQLNINYDPLKEKPDYLIIGPFARTWFLYNDILNQGLFQLNADIGGYQIYQRIASQITNNYDNMQTYR